MRIAIHHHYHEEVDRRQFETLIAMLTAIRREQGELRQEVRSMASRLSTKLDEIETQIADLTNLEAQEDADAAANVAKIADLERQIAELEARETVTDADIARMDALKVKLAEMKAGASAPPPPPEG